MAKNYIDNLSEEARKGQQEKAAQGIWPTKAPLGYFNITGPNGKKIITPNQDISPIITHMFEWYASGNLSLKEIAMQARAAGLVHRRTAGPLPVSNIHAILRNRLYSGDFDWNGRRCKGCHQPLVTRELWDRVQVLDGRNARKLRKGSRDFAFSGLMNCGHCGCALVGEIKKGSLRLLPLHGLQGKMPRTLRSRGNHLREVHGASGPSDLRRRRVSLDHHRAAREPRRRKEGPRCRDRTPSR